MSAYIVVSPLHLPICESVYMHTCASYILLLSLLYRFLLSLFSLLVHVHVAMDVHTIKEYMCIYRYTYILTAVKASLLLHSSCSHPACRVCEPVLLPDWFGLPACGCCFELDPHCNAAWVALFLLGLSTAYKWYNCQCYWCKVSYCKTRGTMYAYSSGTFFE